MTQAIQELEREVAETRARLDRTIDRIQDRLSVSGIVDEIMGSMRQTEFGSVIDQAATMVRRNPVPVLLIAVGVGWLLHRMSQERRTDGVGSALEEESIPVLNTGQSRTYDPDMTSPRHAAHDVLEPRHEAGVRA